MFLVGLTGGIGTGKTTVSQMLMKLGCPVIDADQLARQVVEPGKPAWRQIVKTFGEDIIRNDATLNRELLGQIIFADSDKRKLLNSITHPQIYKAMVWEIIWNFIKGEQFVILDLPLLFETSKMIPYMSYIVVVHSDEDLQLCRLMTRNNYTRAEAEQRISSQLPLAEKCKKATHVIHNSGTMEDTNAQAEDFCRKIRSSKKHWKIRTLLSICLVGVTYSSWRLLVGFYQ